MDAAWPGPERVADFVVLRTSADVFDDDLVASCIARLERDPSLGTVVAARDTGDLPGARTGRDVLGVRTDASVVRARAWEQAGGLALDLDPTAGVLAGIDLGWRLALLGWRVSTLPAVVPLVAADAAPALGTLAIFARNLSEENLRILLPSLVRTRPPGAEAPPLAPGYDLRALEVATEQAARQRVQSTRVRHDRDLLPLVAAAGGDIPWTREVLVSAGVRALVGAPRRIVVTTDDAIGPAMAGPAIRAWEIATALGREHEVVLATTASCSAPGLGFEARAVDDRELGALASGSDIVVFQGSFLQRWRPPRDRGGAGPLLVADLYDPVHLEVLEQERHASPARRGVAQRNSRLRVLEALHHADLVLCASTRQRDLWLGHLAALGRLVPSTYDGDENLDALVAVVPFGLPAEPPRHERAVARGVIDGIGADDALLLWAGGIYNWFDPLTLIHAIDRVRRTRDDVRLLFMGTAHPTPGVPEMQMAARARALADRLELTGRHVFFNDGWVPYVDRQNFLREADIGVSCHFVHVETAFAFRTRILDYLWASLPIVTTEGDTFAALVADRGLGASVPTEDPVALAAAILALLADDAERGRIRARVAEAATDFRWEHVLEPLVAYCRFARAAGDRRGALPDAGARELGALASARDRASAARAALRLRRVWR